ncbi:MAG TPA: [protein-PII] uridylyltransferase [Gammaproteobacteria bacterium]
MKTQHPDTGNVSPGERQEAGPVPRPQMPAANLASLPQSFKQGSFKTYKKILAENLESLTQAFESGVPINELVHARASIMDLLLVDLWNQYFSDIPDTAALIAVGGYGRGELHPKSDIDLMILVDGDILDKRQADIEAFITLLWDLKLEIGHSVRTCGDCAKEAAVDVTVVTNLMESRLLAGSERLFEHMLSVIAESRIWSKEDFFKAKLAEQEQRHRKFDETAYRLEPNIKEGPGGLRDIQTIFWVAKRYFDAARLEDLTSLGFLTRQELDSLLKGRELLWKIRFALHTLAGRREDRLLFDLQRELAKLFGYHDDNANLAVEQFMQNYYRTVTELERLNEMLLQLLHEAIEYPDNDEKPEIINERFEAEHGYLQARHNRVFVESPPALLEAFLIMERHPDLIGVGARTIRLIRNHRHLINQEFRDNPVCRNLFMTILKEPHGVSHELRRMNRYGVLAAYLPEFENIVGRMQYDLFHIYTVDLHTLFVLRNVRRFSVPEHANWQPTCSNIFPTLEHPEILYVAALFHDIAKGRGGDHSELGAHDAERFCINHGFSKSSTQTVKWLVNNHLLMSMTAQRKDISDPAIVHEFALKVGDQKTLNYLYLLTVADISATNPELLSAWRSRLLLELYLRTKHVFRHGLAKPIDAAVRVRERQKEAIEILRRQGVKKSTCRQIWKNFGEDYFLRHVPEEIAWHTQAIAEATPESLPLVLINKQATRGTTAIFIYAEENDDFFAITTAVMSRLGLNIVDARIITSDNDFTLDTYLVLDENNRPITDANRIAEIHYLLSNAIKNPKSIHCVPSRPTPRQLKHFKVPTQITAEDDANSDYTLLEIIAADRPGLLARIGQAFMECGIRVHNAKISTLGENAENIFLVSDRANLAIKDAELRNKLITTLKSHIDHTAV